MVPWSGTGLLYDILIFTRHGSFFSAVDSGRLYLTDNVIVLVVKLVSICRRVGFYSADVIKSLYGPAEV